MNGRPEFLDLDESLRADYNGQDYISQFQRSRKRAPVRQDPSQDPEMILDLLLRETPRHDLSGGPRSPTSRLHKAADILPISDVAAYFMREDTDHNRHRKHERKHKAKEKTRTNERGPSSLIENEVTESSGDAGKYSVKNKVTAGVPLKGEKYERCSRKSGGQGPSGKRFDDDGQIYASSNPQYSRERKSQRKSTYLSLSQRDDVILQSLYSQRPKESDVTFYTRARLKRPEQGEINTSGELSSAESDSRRQLSTESGASDALSCSNDSIADDRSNGSVNSPRVSSNAHVRKAKVVKILNGDHRHNQNASDKDSVRIDNDNTKGAKNSNINTSRNKIKTKHSNSRDPSPRRNLQSRDQDHVTSLKTSDAESSLLRAAFSGDSLTLERDLVNAALSEVRPLVDDYGNTLLHAAVMSGDIHCVSTVYRHCPDLLTTQNTRGHTAAQLATKAGYVDLLGWFLSHTSLPDNPSALDALLWTAVKLNQNHCLRILLSKTLSGRPLVDETNNTPAHFAAMLGSMSCLQTLVEEGCDVTSCNADGLTPREVAELHCHGECGSYLHLAETGKSLERRVMSLEDEIHRLRNENSELNERMKKMQDCFRVSTDGFQLPGVYCNGVDASDTLREAVVLLRAVHQENTALRQKFNGGAKNSSHEERLQALSDKIREIRNQSAAGVPPNIQPPPAPDWLDIPEQTTHDNSSNHIRILNSNDAGVKSETRESRDSQVVWSDEYVYDSYVEEPHFHGSGQEISHDPGTMFYSRSDIPEFTTPEEFFHHTANHFTGGPFDLQQLATSFEPYRHYRAPRFETELDTIEEVSDSDESSPSEECETEEKSCEHARAWYEASDEEDHVTHTRKSDGEICVARLGTLC